MSKCDELESKSFDGGRTAYELMEANGLLNTAKRVKEAIAELKCEIADARDDARSSLELIDEKNKEIAELKAENERLDDLAHSHNLELLQKENCIDELKAKLHDADKRERKTLHALYLLRFAFSKLEQDYIGRFEYNENNLDEMWEKRADYWKAKADTFKEDV